MPSREKVFRTRQHAIDRLVDLVERLLIAGADTVPSALSVRALRAIADVQGGDAGLSPARVTPTLLLNDLLVAEGRLRQQYYAFESLDLEDV
jgi:hypothetical protein